jgi:DNA invertase Pin-like site-specific DNA recombinase
MVGQKIAYGRPLTKLLQFRHFCWSINLEGFNMRKIGYVRVSSSQQNLDRQIAALRAEQCDEIYREKAGGKSMKGRPQLEKAIGVLDIGDVLVVAEWDRVTRSMIDGVGIIERIHQRGAFLTALDKPYLNLATPIGRGFIGFLSAMAEDERKRIIARCNDGRRVAKSRGVKFGRKPVLTEHQQKEALQRLAAGESARSIARSFDCHHATVSRLVGIKESLTKSIYA